MGDFNPEKDSHDQDRKLEEFRIQRARMMRRAQDESRFNDSFIERLPENLGMYEDIPSLEREGNQPDYKELFEKFPLSSEQEGSEDTPINHRRFYDGLES